MAQLSFPISPNVGDKFSSGVGSWSWDGNKWVSRGGEGIGGAPSDGQLYGQRDGNWVSINIPEVPEDVAVVPLGGRLGIVGSSPSNLLRFSALNGNFVRIAGIDYPIPAAGLSTTSSNVFIDGVAGQTLTSATLYYVYLFDNAGTLAFEFSQSAHEISSTPGNIGTEIKSGDNSRSFVGLIYLSGQFRDEVTMRLVRSWFNRSPLVLIATTSWAATTGWDHGFHVNALLFANESVSVTINGMQNNTVQAINYLGVSVDGAIQTGSEINGLFQTTTTGAFTIVQTASSDMLRAWAPSARANTGVVNTTATVIVTILG